MQAVCTHYETIFNAGHGSSQELPRLDFIWRVSCMYIEGGGGGGGMAISLQGPGAKEKKPVYSPGHVTTIS